MSKWMVVEKKIWQIVRNAIIALKQKKARHYRHYSELIRNQSCLSPKTR